jgi:hypothetical protein
VSIIPGDVGKVNSNLDDKHERNNFKFANAIDVIYPLGFVLRKCYRLNDT